MTTNLSPRTGVIIGASGGIGAAVARALRQRVPDMALIGTSRSAQASVGACTELLPMDLTDEGSIAAVFERFPRDHLDFVFIATGVLHTDHYGPEKATKMLDPSVIADVFAHNTTGPALVMKHALPVLKRRSPAFMAALSARVGSVSDNRLGGWHSYRASKAALNQMIRTIAIEAARTHPALTLVGLHPGTVDSTLSKPFQGHVPDGTLFTPDQSAGYMLDTLFNLTPEASGQLYAYDGQLIAP